MAKEDCIDPEYLVSPPGSYARLLDWSMPHSLGEQGIVELAGAFKVSMQPGRLLRVHLQGQGENKRGRWLVSHAPST